MQLTRHGSTSIAQKILCLITAVVLSACGVKGDLYQTQEPAKPEVEQTEKAQPDKEKGSQSNSPNETTK